MSKAAYDYIVVGGGSAGCVHAARLSENPATRALLLEAGHEGKGFLYAVPPGSFALMGNPKADGIYPTASDHSTNGPSIMPNTISGNTNAPVIAVEERAADMIRETAARR